MTKACLTYAPAVTATERTWSSTDVRAPTANPSLTVALTAKCGDATATFGGSHNMFRSHPSADALVHQVL